MTLMHSFCWKDMCCWATQIRHIECPQSFAHSCRETVSPFTLVEIHATNHYPLLGWCGTKQCYSRLLLCALRDWFLTSTMIVIMQSCIPFTFVCTSTEFTTSSRVTTASGEITVQYKTETDLVHLSGFDDSSSLFNVVIPRWTLDGRRRNFCDVQEFSIAPLASS